MNDRRHFEQDLSTRQRRAQEERQAFSERLHRGSRQAGQGWRDDGDVGSRGHPEAWRASADRFGGYRDTGHGVTYEPRGQNQWSRANPWEEEDRFGDPGAWRGGYAQGSSGGSDFLEPPAARGGGVYGGYGIPSGSELGGHGMNDNARGGDRNWSASNWGSQQNWRGDASPGQRWRGRLPKGYTRSDERIKDDVCEQLCRSADVDVGEVSVEVRNGTLVLEGTVPDRRMKHRVEDICEQCIGVSDVENRIRISRERGLAGDRQNAVGEERMGAAGLSSAERPKKGATGTVPPGSAH